MGTALETKALEALRDFVHSYSASEKLGLAYRKAKAVLDEVCDGSGFEAVALKRGFRARTVFVKPDARGVEYGGFEAEACGDGSVKVSKTWAGGRAWICVFKGADDFGNWADEAT